MFLQYCRTSAPAPPVDIHITTRHLATMIIYKIFRSHEWTEFQATGETQGAPIDLHDGFIHFSTASQVTETAAKHFAETNDLMLLACNADKFGKHLKWEPSRGGDLFPHLFSPLKIADVKWASPLPCVEGQHIFPKAMT